MISRPQGPQTVRPQRPSSGAPIIAPAIALVLLVLVSAGSLAAISVLGAFGPGAAATPSPIATQPRATRSPGVTRAPGATDEPTAQPTDTPLPTPAETVLITPPPDRTATIAGTILVTKKGNIYALTANGQYKPLSGRGTDSSPTWAPGGARIYFVQTTDKREDPPAGSGGSKYTMYLTDIMSMNANGKDRTRIFQSLFPKGGGFWNVTAIQPDVSPDGKTIALASDLGVLPDLTDISSVVLSTMTIGGKNLHGLGVRTINDLGHNDPEWSPNGKQIAFTFDDKDGAVGAPKIAILSVGKREPLLLKKGYANPSWSPDGRYIVCEQTTGVGRDVVVIDPNADGAEVAQLTNDGDSFAPVWSPNGDQIAYLHRTGLAIDLRIITLDSSNSLSLLSDKPLTEDGRIDAESPPAWFIPDDERTVPVVTPAPEVSTGPETSPTAQ